MVTSQLPRRSAVLERLTDSGWSFSARRSEHTGTSAVPGAPAVRVNVVTGEATLRGDGWSVTFAPATPDHVVIAAAEARPEAVGAASGVAA